MLVYRNVVYCVAKILHYFRHDIKLLKNNQTNRSRKMVKIGRMDYVYSRKGVKR